MTFDFDTTIAGTPVTLTGTVSDDGPADLPDLDVTADPPLDVEAHRGEIVAALWLHWESQAERRDAWRADR